MCAGGREGNFQYFKQFKLMWIKCFYEGWTEGQRGVIGYCKQLFKIYFSKTIILPIREIYFFRVEFTSFETYRVSYRVSYEVWKLWDTWSSSLK